MWCHRVRAAHDYDYNWRAKSNQSTNVADENYRLRQSNVQNNVFNFQTNFRHDHG